MRAVIQRTKQASVVVEGATVAQIEYGLMIFLGIENEDDDEDIKWLSNKIINLRIFSDENRIMNKNINSVAGDIILVSQFTLHASTKKGNRPSYIKAAKPEVAIPIYERLIAQIEKDFGKKIQKGIFGADMKVSLLNDGPVTIFIDTKNKE